MNLLYLCVVFLVGVPICAMEQVSRKVILKSAPSLREIALKSYAKLLHTSAPKKDASDDELVSWGERVGLQSFFEMNFGDLLDQIVSEPIIDPVARFVKTTVRYCPVLSPDACCGLQIDFQKKKQHLVYCHDDLLVCKEIPAYLAFDSNYRASNPIISLGGEWLMGKRGDDDAQPTILIHHVLSGSESISDITKYAVPFKFLYDMDYTFYDTKTILIRTAKDIFSAPIADFAVSGRDALQKIYSRNDDKAFPSTLFFKTIYAIRDSLVACVGPDFRSIELLKYDENVLCHVKTVSVPYIGLGRLIMHSGRGTALIVDQWVSKGFSVCKLTHAQGHVSTINVDMVGGGPSSYVFSPDGLFIAYNTRRANSEGIEISDLRNQDSPQSIAFIESKVFNLLKPICVAWFKQGLLVCNVSGSEYAMVQFTNYAVPLIARYAAYRKMQEKAKASENQS